MRKLYLALGIVLFSLTAMGQDWLGNKSKLFYVSGGEKVYMTPDYSSVAVYFKEEPSEKSLQLMKETVQEKFAQQRTDGTAPKLEMVKGKGVLRISSVATDKFDQDEFLQQYKLAEEGAYAALPSFNVGGVTMWMTKRVNVGLEKGVDISSIQAVLDKYGATLQKSRLDDTFITFNVETLENQLPMIQELSAKNLIEWGAPDFKAEIKKYADPLYQYQWHLNNTGGTDWSGNFSLTAGVDIDAEDAWTVTTGSSDITIAVIDDGLAAHEDFPTLLTGYTPATGGNGTPDYTNDPYHAEACGGLVFAQHNEIGVRGVAPGVSAFSVNIFDSGTTNADVADGVIWAVDNGADVLTNSWGYSSCTANLVPSISSAFSYAATSGRSGLGCVILVAAGNDFSSCVSFPANLSTVTAVGALNGQGVRSTYSNYGSALDIMGPSNDVTLNSSGTAITDYVSDIVSTDLPGSYGENSGLYYYEFGGTSAATPITAGVACLVLSVDPTLTKSEVENILYSTAVDYGTSGYDTGYGYGLVNAYQAVLAAGGTGSSCDLDAPDNFAASSVTDSTFVLSWDAVDSAAYYIVTAAGASDSLTTTTYAVSGLEPGTDYYCTVKAYCADGGSGSTSTLTVSTTGTNPSVSDILVESGFDTGFEGFTGGSYSAWYSGSGYMSTAPFVYIADDRSTSIITSPSFDASSYEQIYLEFDLMFYQMEGSDRLDVYYYNGSSWTNLGGVYVSEFGNNTTISVSAAINTGLSSSSRFRFEGEGNGSYDYSFIDNVTITGNSGTAVVSGAGLLTTPSLSTQFVATTGFEDALLGERTFDIYPNPVKDVLTIKGIALGDEVKLMSISGQVLDQGIGKDAFDMSELKGGLYLLQIFDGEDTKTLKVLKQ